MKQLLYAALVNAIQNPESNDGLPIPLAIASKLVESAKAGDMQAMALILQIAEFEPKDPQPGI